MKHGSPLKKRVWGYFPYFTSGLESGVLVHVYLRVLLCIFFQMGNLLVCSFITVWEEWGSWQCICSNSVFILFQLFGKVYPDDDVISSNNNFKTFGGALMVLFRSATGVTNSFLQNNLLGFYVCLHILMQHSRSFVAQCYKIPLVWDPFWLWSNLSGRRPPQPI